MEKKIINGKKTTKALYAYIRMFEAQDDDYPDNRKVAANERAFHKALDEATTNEKDRQELQELIEGGWACGMSFIDLLHSSNFYIEEELNEKGELK